MHNDTNLKTYIFNTRINNISHDEIIDTVDRYLQGDTFHQIATINSEILLQSRNDTGFREILNRCDLNIADSVGLNIALWRMGDVLRARIPGADLMDYVLRYAEEKQLRVCCIIRRDGLSNWECIRNALSKIYPKLFFTGISMGFSDGNILSLSNDERDALFNSHVILCNFGAPYQETFLASLREDSINIRLAMGIGGSFDYMTKALPRAPKWMRRFGLEWVWRLIWQPSRFRRIWNAVVVFPIRVIGGK